MKDLRNPAKKWKLEKNAQQLFMTGTVLLYQVLTIGISVLKRPKSDQVRLIPFPDNLGPFVVA